MTTEEKNQVLIQEIHEKIDLILNADNLSEEQKVIIFRNVLHRIENIKDEEM